MLCFRCIRYCAAKLRKKTKTCTIITEKIPEIQFVFIRFAYALREIVPILNTFY